jgi:hypothetical protein
MTLQGVQDVTPIQTGPNTGPSQTTRVPLIHNIAQANPDLIVAPAIVPGANGTMGRDPTIPGRTRIRMMMGETPTIREDHIPCYKCPEKRYALQSFHVPNARQFAEAITQTSGQGHAAPHLGKQGG